MFLRVISFDFKSVPKIITFSMLNVKTTLINAEDQNNTYKAIKDMPEVRNTSVHL